MRLTDFPFQFQFGPAELFGAEPALRPAVVMYGAPLFRGGEDAAQPLAGGDHGLPEFHGFRATFAQTGLQFGKARSKQAIVGMPDEATRIVQFPGFQCRLPAIGPHQAGQHLMEEGSGEGVRLRARRLKIAGGAQQFTTDFGNGQLRHK